MRTLTSDQLSDAIVDRNLMSADEIEELKQVARRQRTDLIDLITARGRFPSSAVYCAAAEVRGIPFVDYHRVKPSPELAREFPASVIKRGAAIPVSRQGNRLLVAAGSPEDHLLIAEIERRTGFETDIALAEPSALRDAASYLLTELYPREATLTDPDPVEAFDRIMKEAYLRRASDIHLDPQKNGLVAKIRVDGRLEPLHFHISTQQAQGLVSRIKVLAGLDIAEQRSAQDGGFTYEIPGLPDTSVDLRIATLAARWGERVTIRVLATETKAFSLEETGMPAASLKTFQEALKLPHGMILITGPTGSGKSTTLYAALRSIYRPEVNIMTLEDPIESNIDGITQVSVSRSEKMTFAKGLRSMLRHDPDVLMVGEIRDQETAEVALRAAMTGHLIFSTLHTNDAPSAVSRLLDIGCQPYLIASTLACVVAQRLVRRLCPGCKVERQATEEERHYLEAHDEDLTIYGPSDTGCSRCVGTGFQGRVGIFEVLRIDKELQRLIADQQSRSSWEQAIESRMTELKSDGCQKVMEGLTTVEEITNVAAH